MRSGNDRLCTRCRRTRLRMGNPGTVCGPCARAQLGADVGVPEPPAGFWFRPEVVRACGMWDLGLIFALYMRETGISAEKLGDLVGRSQAQIWRLSRGRHACFDIRIFRTVADVLGCPPRLLGLASPEMDSGVTVEGSAAHAGAAAEGGDRTKRRQLLAMGAAGLIPVTGRLGEADVGRLRQSVREMHAIDKKRGGAALVDLARRSYERARTALGAGRFASGRVERELQTVTAELASSTGWFAFDAGRDHLARANFAEARHLAELAEDDLEVVDVLAMMSLQATWTGRPYEAVQLAQHARQRARGWATPRLLCELSIREARGWAKYGDRAEFQKATNRAKHYFDQGSSDGDPAWLGFCNSGHVLGSEAFGWIDLGQYRRGEQLARQELTQLADPSHARNNALAYIRLAESVQAQGGAAEAARVALTGLVPVLGEVDSARVRQRAAALRRELEPYKHRHREVATFVQAYDRDTAAAKRQPTG
jgi:hypothetical protein